MRIARDFPFQTGADERRFGNDQRNALALHVRTHQRAVRVVMFEEWNQSGRDRNELLRRNVHVVDFRRLDFEEVAAITHGNFFTGEMTAAVNRRVRLRDEVIFFAIAREIIDLDRSRGRLSTLRYGVSMKPNSLIRAKVDIELIRPMFGPSGVSIGQIRP